VVTVTGVMRVPVILAGQGFGLRLRTPEVGTEEVDEHYWYVPAITDPEHVHDTTAEGALGISGSTGEAQAHDHTDGTLYTHSHDHGDTGSASTGITVDDLAYLTYEITQVWSFTVSGDNFVINLDAKHFGSGGQTPDMAIKYTVARAWA